MISLYIFVCIFELGCAGVSTKKLYGKSIRLISCFFWLWGKETFKFWKMETKNCFWNRVSCFWSLRFKVQSFWFSWKSTSSGLIVGNSTSLSHAGYARRAGTRVCLTRRDLSLRERTTTSFGALVDFYDDTESLKFADQIWSFRGSSFGYGNYICCLEFIMFQCICREFDL